MTWTLRGKLKKGQIKRSASTCLSSHSSILHNTPPHRPWNPLHRLIHLNILLFCFVLWWAAEHFMMSFYGWGYFCLMFKEKKKSQLWTIASSSSSQQTVPTGAQQILYRLTQFMAAFCGIITHFFTCTPSFCIKHLSDLSSFVFFTAEFSTFLYTLTTSREIPKECVLIHLQKDPLKPLLLLFFPSFSSAIRFHYLPDNYTLLHSHISSVKDLNFSEYLWRTKTFTLSFMKRDYLQ